jgi:hypothetical protein
MTSQLRKVENFNNKKQTVHEMASLSEILQNSVSAISNPVYQRAAQTLLNVAIADGSGEALGRVAVMFDLPAKAEGSAIFYSGTGPNGLQNAVNAANVRDVTLGGDGYTSINTPLGRYIDSNATGVNTAEAFGYLPLGFYRASVDYLSAKMADQAEGPIIAWYGRNTGTVY